MLVENTKISCEKMIQKTVEKIENGGEKVLKIIMCPNSLVGRIYLDDLMFIHWSNVKFENLGELINFLNGIKSSVEMLIFMESKDWEKEFMWTTNHMDFEFLKYNRDCDKWWNWESRRGKLIELQYENII